MQAEIEKQIDIVHVSLCLCAGVCHPVTPRARHRRNKLNVLRLQVTHVLPNSLLIPQKASRIVEFQYKLQGFSLTSKPQPRVEEAAHLRWLWHDSALVPTSLYWRQQRNILPYSRDLIASITVICGDRRAVMVGHQIA